MLGICTKRDMVKRAALSQPEIKQSCFCWKAYVWSAPGERSKRKCEKITYYAWLKKWLDSCAALSHSHIIFLRNVTSVNNKILFSR